MNVFVGPVNQAAGPVAVDSLARANALTAVCVDSSHGAATHVNYRTHKEASSITTLRNNAIRVGFFRWCCHCHRSYPEADKIITT